VTLLAPPAAGQLERGARAAIEGSDDLSRLRRWLGRAVTAASADDVIDAP
jgi:hypothetical protein